MKFQPHTYQKYCIERILDTPNVGLFLDMGLGKTLITLSAVNELMYHRFEIDKTLVIAPKKVAEATWQNEIEKWDAFQFLRYSTVLGSAKEREAALEAPADIYIINRDNVVWLVNYYKNSWPFDCVVCDEFTSFKNHQAKRFKALASVKPHVKKLIGLTGTPSPNGLLDLWAQVYLLDGGARLSPSYYSYRNAYFESDYMGYEFTPRPFSKEAISEKLSDICISMKAEDYLELPDCIEHEIPVVLNPKARKAYDTMEREAVLEITDVDEISATSAAALTTKLLQLANGAVYDEDGEYHIVHDCKIEAFMETLERLQGKNVLVFYSFKHDLDRLIKALTKAKMNFRKLETKGDQQDWNDGKIQVLLTHPASSAYGLNLQAGGNHVIWFGLTWNYELYVQANKRLHRQGQTERVIIHHLVTKETRDGDVMTALEHKEQAQNYVLESLKARIKRVRGEEVERGR